MSRGAEKSKEDAAKNVFANDPSLRADSEKCERGRPIPTRSGLDIIFRRKIAKKEVQRSERPVFRSNRTNFRRNVRIPCFPLAVLCAILFANEMIISFLNKTIAEKGE